ECDGLYRDAALELPRRALGFALALVGPEERCRRDIDPFEAALDRREMRLDEIVHLWAELVDQERAAGADDLGRRFGDIVADTWWKGREREPGEHGIGRAKVAVGKDL